MAKELEPDDKAGEKLDDKSLAADAHIDEIGALNGDGFSRVISIPVIADAKDDARSSARPGVGPLLDIRAAVKESDTKDLSLEAAVVREQEAVVVIVFDLPDGSQARARPRGSLRRSDPRKCVTKCVTRALFPARERATNNSRWAKRSRS